VERGTFRDMDIHAVASEQWGQGVHCTTQVQDLYPLYLPSQRCGLCQNFKQTTVTTRLYKVRTNLYPHLRKRSYAPAYTAQFGHARTCIAIRHTQHTQRYTQLTRMCSFVVDKLDVIIPTKAFARDYVITGVGLSVCLYVCYHDK